MLRILHLIFPWVTNMIKKTRIGQFIRKSSTKTTKFVQARWDDHAGIVVFIRCASEEQARVLVSSAAPMVILETAAFGDRARMKSLKILV